MTRHPITTIEKFILASATGIAAAGLFATAVVYLNTEKPKTADAAVPDTYETICIAGGYERTNGRMVIDMFTPGVGVETIEDVSKETYDSIIKEIGTC